MKQVIPYYVFDVHESDIKQGQTWEQIGLRYGMAMMLHHGEDRLAWLNARFGNSWQFHIRTTQLPRPADNPAHEPSVRLHVEIEFASTADAVLYKLTWGGEED
jgi:predicted 3-demethylubiquinone-9 3-methyltransferase (glyoxalase superfamily)